MKSKQDIQKDGEPSHDAPVLRYKIQQVTRDQKNGVWKKVGGKCIISFRNGELSDVAKSFIARGRKDYERAILKKR